MVDIEDLNPLGDFSVGFGDFWNYIVLFVIAIGIVILIGIIIFIVMNSRKYKYRIPLYSTIGNVPTEIKIFKACDFSVGKAGDKLWYVKTAKKFISPAVFQSAPNKFPHYMTKDGEWLNFQFTDLNEEKEKLGLKFLQKDMSLARLSTDRLLEQRLMDKGFWEKWGIIIGYVIFFLMITVAMVIFFYELAKVVEALATVTQTLDGMLKITLERERGQNSLVPVTQIILGWLL